jgi:TetR/AcrR family transcriptional repressor for divergent bdcA
VSKDGIAGCLVLDGVRNSGDADAAALIADYKAQSRAMIEARFAKDHPARAAELASIVTIALSGLSASAHDGASETELLAFARTAARAFREETRAGTGGPRVRIV